MPDKIDPMPPQYPVPLDAAAWRDKPLPQLTATEVAAAAHSGDTIAITRETLGLLPTDQDPAFRRMRMRLRAV